MTDAEKAKATVELMNSVRTIAAAASATIKSEAVRLGFPDLANRVDTPGLLMSIAVSSCDHFGVDHRAAYERAAAELETVKAMRDILS